MASTIKSSTITFKNLDVTTPSIDLDRIDEQEEKINKLIAQIIAEIDSFKQAYDVVAKDSRTKGTFKKNAEAVVKAAKKYHSEFTSLSNQLEKAINRSALAYAVALYSNSKPVEQAASQINTQA